MCKRFIVLLAVFGLLASTGSTVFSQENDEPCGAIALESGDSATGSTADATPDAGALFPNAPGVWYTIVGNRGVATVGTCGEGSAYDTALSVFTGSCAPATANTSTSGGDIWTGGDDFQFDYTEITGDFDVAIEMVDYSHDTGAGRWGKMGLMARRELTRESEFMQTQFHGPALDDVSRQAGRREHGVAGGGMYEILMDGAGPRPVYTRLTRRGNVFQSWWSAEAPADPRDDASWTAGHAEDRGTMPETVFVGFANSEHNSDGAIPQTVTYLSLNDDFNEINAFVGNDAGGGSGTAVAGLTAILSNDDACVRPGQCCLSSISWETEEDVTYYILVHGWNTDSGPYQLDVSLGEPGATPVNPNGWIQAEAWNMLILDQDGGCGGGGVGRMAGDWTGFDLFDSDPQAGDQWDIDFGAVESRGWTLTAVAELPTWATTAFLNDNGVAVNGQDDLVNFDAYVAALGANTDNLVAISTTYVENTTDADIQINFCTSSDDSIRADLNENLITNASACRGSAGNCQERACATLLPGMNKITTHVWEGGGGFNMRFGLRTLTDQVINDANDLGIVFHGSGGGDLEGQAGGVAGCDIDFGIARNGWIQASGWNWMAPLLNPLGCGGGGQGVMGSNWVPPYDLGTEDPKAGDEWDIDFGASPSNGFNNGGLSDGPIWVTHAYVADNLGVELPDGDLVDFQGIAVTLQNAGIGGGIPNDNVMSIATTYVQNNTDSPLAVDICTASDDSVLTMLNCNIITNVSACRGSGGDCQERRPAVLLPGINKLSALVWEGGGGWNMRVAVEYNGAKVNSFPGIPEITLLGAGDADTVGQPTLCVARTATLSDNACPQASVPFQITGNGGGVAGDSVTVVESFGGNNLDAYTITDISHGGEIVSAIGFATLNVGPNGVATQSSEGWGGAPGRAIDGNTDGQWGGGSVTHTNGANSWWEVDLQASYYIESIRLWNRLDCCSERLANFTVQVLDIDRNVVFESAGLNANSAVNFNVPDVDADGQIVRVSMPADFLSLAEVEIFSPTEAEVTTELSIVWDTDVASVNAGLSYTLAYSASGSSSASGTFDLGGGPTPVDGISGVPFASDATGPIGDFDNSHLIGDANTGGVTYDADSDSYTVEANGSDIWNGGDHMAFAYKAVTGDFVATVHIADRIDGASGRWGKHGLMARQSCHSNSRYSMIQTNLSGVNEAEIDLPRHAWRWNHLENGSSNDVYQVDDGALAGFDPDAGQRVNRRPTWMRMYRVGALIQTQLAFEDADGEPIQWQTIGGDSHPDRPDTLLVGLALTNHSGDVGSAVFDQVSIEAYDPGADESVRGDEIGPLDLAAGAPEDSGLVVVQAGGYRPEVLDNGHLRITSNAVASSANAVWLPQPLDLSSGFVLEFDAFMGPTGCDPGTDPNPADGFTLTMIEVGGTGDPLGAFPSDLALDSLRGDGGGAEGLWGNALLQRTEGHGSFSVEFDNWVGGFDPATGGSPNNDCAYHVGLLANTMVNTHVATNMDLGVGTADLPSLFTEEGVHVAVKYAPNGHVTVTLNDELVVIDSHVVPLSGDLILGFTGGTGGATADQEVANITLYELGAAGPTFADAGYWEFDNSLAASTGQPDLDAVAYEGVAPGVAYEAAVINGEDAIVGHLADGAALRVHHGLAPNGGGSYVNDYTLIMDVLFPVVDNWISLYQTNGCGDTDVLACGNDGDWFVNTSNGIGIGGNYGGSVQANTWHRLALTVDSATGLYTSYLDGEQVQQNVDAVVLDGRFALYSQANAPPTDWVLLFADETGVSEMGEVLINSAGIINRALSGEEVTALGGPNAAGVSVAGPLPPEPPVDQPNDLCDGAIALDVNADNLSVSIDGSTAEGANADAENADCSASTAPGLWYSVTGVGGSMTASLCGSNYDTKISVFSGACGGVTCVASNDDSCGLQSVASWVPEEGATYLVLVHGFGSSSGDFTLTVEAVLAMQDNDDCGGAIGLDLATGQAVVEGSTVTGATPDAESGDCGASTAPGIWYSAVGNGGTMSAGLCGSDYDTKISVFSGDCGALSCVASNDDSCGLQSVAGWDSEDGATYRILVHGFSTRSGNFILTVDQGAPPAAGVGPFIRGDANGDSTVDISDATTMLNWLFLGSAEPGCVASNDSNGDGAINISDPTHLLNFLFLGGTAPPAPSECGNSESAGDEALGCASGGC